MAEDSLGLMGSPPRPDATNWLSFALLQLVAT